jgi:hypothetical protein
MILASDADQVFLDLYSSWKSFAEIVLDRELIEISNSYSFVDRYNISMREFFKVSVMFDDGNHWENINVIQSGVDALNMVLDMGHEVHIVTSIPGEVKEKRDKQFLRLFGRHYNKTIFMHVSKSNYNNFCSLPTKQKLLNDLRPIFYADDRWPHCGEAKSANVPFVSFIESSHCGDGAPVNGVGVYSSLQQAICEFLK